MNAGTTARQHATGQPSHPWPGRTQPEESAPCAFSESTSIIIPVYGAADWLLRCLDALHRNTAPGFEVILIDNGSPESPPTGNAAGQVAARYPATRIHHNPTNLGFGVACNQGAALSKKNHLCFLNSDALVRPGWLPALHRTLAEAPNAAAAAPVFLNTDDSVQEAGSVSDCDGSTRAIAEGSAAEHALRIGRQRCDYASAACLLLRRNVFLELGGFDPVWAPAYFEDVDLCYALRQRGLAIYTDPAATVEHARGASSDPEQAVDLMRRNRPRFVQRWNSVLKTRPRFTGNPERDRPLLTAARDARRPDRLLIIDDRIPHADRGSGDPRMAQFLETVTRNWPEARVTLLPGSDERAAEYLPATSRMGIEVLRRDATLRRRLAADRYQYSAVLVSRPHNVASFAPLIARYQPQALKIYDAEALFSRRLEQELRAAPHGARPAFRRQLETAQQAERAALEWADQIVFVTPEEAALASRIAPGRPVHLLPGYTEPEESVPGPEGRSGVLFFGGFLGGPGSPNEDAARRLARSILPLIHRKRPEEVLDIIGADPTNAVQALESDPRVRVHGRVADPALFLDRARVLVVPLRYGAGIKYRFVETLARRLPFVTTSLGAEGLGLDGLGPDGMGRERPESGPSLPDLVRGTDAEIAAAALHLLESDNAWRNAHDFLGRIAARNFGHANYLRRLSALLGAAGFAPARATSNGASSNDTNSYRTSPGPRAHQDPTAQPPATVRHHP